MGFSVHKTRIGFEILYGNQVIARSDRNYGYHVLRDLVLRPGGEALIASHQIAPHCYGRVDVAPTVDADDDRAIVRLEADSDDGCYTHVGTATVTRVPKTRSFLWDFVHDTRVLKTHPFPERFFMRTDVDSQFRDTGVWVFEFTDPLPCQPFAPKDGPVGVDRPDILYPVPWFRKGGWKKNWTHFLFKRYDGPFVRIPMNHLENHDKDFWRQAPDGVMAMLGGKGTNLQYRFLEGTGRNVCHHYCMWGYDIHFLQIEAPGSGTGKNPPPKVKKGRRYYHHYVLETLTDKQSRDLLRRAEDHPWREVDQRRLDNVARYNVGLNRFQTHLGRQDDGGLFRPSSECLFLPTHPGRRTPGCLCIDNHLVAHAFDDPTPPYNAWMIGLGSDNWHTPIERKRRYEVSVWVKMEGEPGTLARIAMNYQVQRNQAKPSFRVTTSKTHYSNAAEGKTGWVKLVLTTPRMPDAYVSTLRIAMELVGRGIAYFDEFECRMLKG